MTESSRPARKTPSKDKTKPTTGNVLEEFDGLTVGGKKYGRSTIVAILVLVGVLATPLGLAGKWAFDTINSQDAYVALVSDMAQEPAIKQAVASEVASLAMNKLDLQSLIGGDDGWRGKLNSVLGSLTGKDAAAAAEERIRPIVESGVTAFVGSSKFQTVWSGANREAHAAVLGALQDTTADINGLSASGDVTIDLSPVLGEVDTSSQLLALVGNRLLQNSIEIPLLKSEQVDALRPAYSLAASVSTWAPIVGVIALNAALVLARKRWIVGLCIGGAFLLVAFLPTVFEIYLSVAQPAALTGESLSAQVARHIADEAVAQSSSGLGYGVPVGLGIIGVTCVILLVVALRNRSRSVAG